MAEQSKARPRWTQDNGLHVSVERNGKWRRVPDDQVSPRVRERVLGQLDGTKQTRADDLTAEMIEHGTIPVEFDWEKNFKRVRIPGEAWVEPDHPIEQATTPVGPITAEPSRFLNPYGFVSTEPRGNDLGARRSHAAMVAGELGVPAVVGCGDATARLRTGDRVLLDGAAGTVQVLARAAG